jgi:hypothetical protein
VDRSNLESYAPTNLYPYLMTPSNEEVELLKFIETNQIKKMTTQTSVTIANMKEILDFLEAPMNDRKGLKLFGDYSEVHLGKDSRFLANRDNRLYGPE